MQLPLECRRLERQTVFQGIPGAVLTTNERNQNSFNALYSGFTMMGFTPIKGGKSTERD